MIKFIAPYALHAVCILLLVYGLMPLLGTDLYIYGYSVSGAILFISLVKRELKDKIFQFFAFQSVTLWLCHFYLPTEFRTLTQHLVSFREWLLVLLVVIELSIAYVLIRSYKRFRVKSNSSSEALLQALLNLGMPPELTKLFVVEWNIWGNLIKRVSLKVKHRGPQYLYLSTGYSKKLTISVFAFLFASFIFCLSFIPGVWKVIVGLVFFYFIILFHGDLVGFYKPISKNRDGVYIPNGVFGSVFVKPENIKHFALDKAQETTLKIGRLIEPSLLVVLHEPINYFGQHFESIAICMTEADFRKVLYK